MKRSPLKKIALLALGAICCALPVQAGDEAQQPPCQLEPVVVSAQKRTEDAQDVPMSMTVLEDTDIEDMGIQDTTGLAEHVPGLEFNDFGSRRHGLMFLRGIKSIPTGEPSTGYFVDGVSYSKSYMFNFPLFDVQHVEVLRGPQGTLYGRNTLGGVINVATRQPGNTPAAGLEAEYGSYDLGTLRGSVSGPIVEDTLYLGLYGLSSVRDGFMENDVDADGEDGRHQDGKAGRMRLRYTPTGDLDVNLTLDGQRHDDGAYSARRTARNALVKAGTFAADEAGHYSHDFEGSQDNDCFGAALDTEYSAPWGTLRSITGFRDYDSDERIDADFSPLDTMRKRYRQTDQDLSQEFRLASPEGNGPVSWLAGTYLFHLHSRTDISNLFGANSAAPGRVVRFDTHRTNKGGALFGQLAYALLENLDLTVGLRGEYEQAGTVSEQFNTPAGGATTRVDQVDQAQDFNALLPKFALSWDMDEDHTLYTTAARAHRSGGCNDASAPAGSEAFDEEYSWQYEVGLKSFLLDKRLMLNTAAFYTTIEDEQLPLFDAATMQSYTANAGRSHRQGLEAEARFKVTGELELSASYAWIQAEFDSYSDAVTGVDYAGNRVFCVPEHSYSLGAEYRRPLWSGWRLFGRMDLNGTGARFFDDANEVEAGAYELVNLRVGLEGEDLDVYFWIRNALDKEYVLFENTSAGIAEDGPPRTLGVSIRYRF